ncbi:GerMN domain-containing protein [Cohnella sp. REN36]|uniref:GerMN domain-containing protein n=1 Tax=Cohnella sp. REN36 TaxID=2887347 RepID=UPI001D13C62F|nr:GerMN domain-containing protein [Cohnella sp. REN36]MCC3375714.1 GerMN domain-containing protein [Cohnella sp. REN36]
MIASAVRRRSAKLIASAGLVLLIAGCSFAGQQGKGSDPIDQPPADVESQMLQQTEQAAASASSVAIADGLTVYLQDRHGFVAPMTLSQPQADDGKTSRSPEETAIAWMTADPKLAMQLPPGFTPILPQGTKIKAVRKDLANGVVTIDFASPLPTIAASQERKVVEALVWTMTELPGVEKVRLELDGKPLTSLPSGLPIASVLTRDMGINLEQAAGVKASRSMAVTLYFSAKTAEGEGYFVPVTRLVDRQPDRARAALNELIKGPSDTKKLEPVLVSDTSVEQLSVLSDTVVVKLQEKGWVPKAPVPEVPADMMQALVLTMTEATKAPKVQLALNGNTELLDTDNRSYAQPVTRPTQINALAR